MDYTGIFKSNLNYFDFCCANELFAGDKAMEFFAGSQTVSKLLRQMGFNCISVDIDEKLKPDYCVDILKLDYAALPAKLDFAWFSPDCTYLSRAGNATNWKRNNIKKRVYEYEPLTANSVNSVALVAKCFEIIARVRPDYFVIENPIGRIQHLQPMKSIGMNRYFVNYGDWGFDYSKETYLFTNLMLPLPTKKQPSNYPGLRTVNNRRQRSHIPESLLKFIFSYL